MKNALSILFILLFFHANAVKGQTKKVETFYDYNKTKLKETFDALTVSPYLKNGNYKLYSKNTVLLKDYTYSKGKKNGRCIDYYESGKVESEKIYKDDSFNGVCTDYYPTGQVKAKATFLNGKINGTYIKYAENGNTIEEGSAINDIQDGTIKKYWDNGNLYTWETYKNGHKNGVYRSFYQTGKMELQCNYVNGELDGNYQSFYEGEDLEQDFTYKAGKKNGAFKTYYINRQLEGEGEFLNDNFHGSMKTYYSNGQPWKVLTADNGIKIGDEIIYTNSGKLKITNTYTNGEITKTKVECTKPDEPKICSILANNFNGNSKGLETKWITLISDANNDLKIEYKITRDFTVDSTLLFQLKLTPINVQTKMQVVCAYYDIIVSNNKRFDRFNGTGYIGKDNFKVIGNTISNDLLIELGKVKVSSIKRLNNEEGNCGNELGINSAFGNSGKLKSEYSVTKEDAQLFQDIINAITN